MVGNYCRPWRSLTVQGIFLVSVAIAKIDPTVKSTNRFANAFVATKTCRSSRVMEGCHSAPSISHMTSSLCVTQQSDQDIQQQQQREERRLELVGSFVDKLQESIDENIFQSLTLRGVKAPKNKNGSGGIANEEMESLRGSIRQVHGRLVRLKTDEVLLQFTLKYHLATDIVKNIPLSDSQETLKNLILDPAVASEWGVQAVRCHPMRGALLETTSEIWDLSLDKKPKLRKQKVKVDNKRKDAITDINCDLSHDRVKQAPVSIHADFLQRLGVTKPDGKPRNGMKSKLRQCQKFVEIVGNLVDKTASQETATIQTMDLGCGRGYLTFALHAYLCEKYDDLNVSTVGIDVRPKLIDEISTIAGSLGGSFDTLKFEVGTIEKMVSQASAMENADNQADKASLDILVALHACDTATDDAIYSGIARNADVIVVAPCCQKELRPQIDAGTSTDHPILRHAIYRERFTEIATDSLRGLLLEMVGYKVKTFEFIGGEHTAKNVMITAIKESRQKDNSLVLRQIHSLADEYGLMHQKLAQRMGVELVNEEDSVVSTVADSEEFSANPKRNGPHRMASPTVK